MRAANRYDVRSAEYPIRCPTTGPLLSALTGGQWFLTPELDVRILECRIVVLKIIEDGG
jgi:hypothetical protein